MVAVAARGGALVGVRADLVGADAEGEVAVGLPQPAQTRAGYGEVDVLFLYGLIPRRHQHQHQHHPLH